MSAKEYCLNRALAILTESVSAKVTTSREVAKEFIQSHTTDGTPLLEVRGITRRLRFRVNELGMAELWTETKQFVP